MASTPPSQELPAHDTFYQSHDTTLPAKPSLSQEGSLEDKNIGKGSYTVKEVQDGTPKHISGHWKSILGNGALVSILMIGIAVAMLTLVLPFKMDPFNLENLTSDHYFFLRNIPTSAIICITSLSSLLSILLLPSLLKLSSYFHAHDLLVNSVARDHGGLPSTRDFAMLLQVLTGCPHAFVQAFRRSFAKPTSGRKMIRKANILSAIAILLR
jgi:hypothetical protein